MTSPKRVFDEDDHSHLMLDLLLTSRLDFHQVFVDISLG